MKTFMVLVVLVAVAAATTAAMAILGFWPGMAAIGIATTVAFVVAGFIGERNPFAGTTPQQKPQADVAPLEEKAEEALTKRDLAQLLGLSGFPDGQRGRRRRRNRGRRQRK